jgi:hypothetical protein
MVTRWALGPETDTTGGLDVVLVRAVSLEAEVEGATGLAVGGAVVGGALALGADVLAPAPPAEAEAGVGALDAGVGVGVGAGAVAVTAAVAGLDSALALPVVGAAKAWRTHDKEPKS